MRLNGFAWLLIAVFTTGYCRGQTTPQPNHPYLYYVRSMADSLLTYGVDRFGPRQTAQWAALIDTRTGGVPRRGVPTVAGVRPADRAVGGSNLYQDVASLRAFRLLSDLTGDETYRKAAGGYLRDAHRYARLAIRHLWRGGWFVRQTDDPYYEAKLGTGSLLLGLLRLHSHTVPGTKSAASLPQDVDWSK